MALLRHLFLCLLFYEAGSHVCSPCWLQACYVAKDVLELFLVKNYFYLILYVWVFDCMYVYVPCLCFMLEETRREHQMLMSCYVGAENGIWVLWKNRAISLSHRAISPTPALSSQSSHLHPQSAGMTGRLAPPHPVYVVMGKEPRALPKLKKHSATWVTATNPGESFFNPK